MMSLMIDPAMLSSMAAASEQTLGGTQAGEPVETQGRPLERGTLIGRYIVAGTLGAGAMGVVMAAYDPELDRKVAIKLLRSPGDAGDPARVRLQREAQALAKLDHRNVVAVFDVGEHEGQLFVAMEFVVGRNMETWLNEVETPRPWPEVVRVFMAAGRGLAEAHGAGLIHRDFKPANVMLGDDGRVRVMDFGLARTTTDTARGTVEEDQNEDEELRWVEELRQSTGRSALDAAVTRAGLLLGTPAYMAPEQLEGRPADAASDQFAFCVALWEALHGVRPFAAQTLEELRATIKQHQLRPASSPVPGWIREHLRRGLAPDPGARWPSMHALLDALASDPRVRRRQWLAGAAAVALLAGGSWSLARASATANADSSAGQACAGFEIHLEGVWDRERRAELRTSFEATQLSYANETWSRVEKGLDTYTRGWVGAREQACEATRRGEQSGELLDLRMACLDERRRHLSALVEVFAEPDAKTLSKATQAVASLPTLERCADLDALVAAQPPPEDGQSAAEVEAIELRLVEARTLRVTGKYEVGLARGEAIVVDAEALGYEPLLVRVLLSLGELRQGVGDFEGAAEVLQRAYALALRLGIRPEAARAATKLVYVVGYRLARHAEAGWWARGAEPLVEGIGGAELHIQLLTNRGLLAREAGELEQAREFLEQAAEMIERDRGSENVSMAKQLSNLGNIAADLGDAEASWAYHQRARALFEAALGPGHPQLSAIYNNLGSSAFSRHRLDEAQTYFERALAIVEATQGSEHPMVAVLTANLGNIAYERGDLEHARANYAQALSMWQTAFGSEHPTAGAFLVGLGRAALGEGDHAGARAHFEQALALYETVFGPDHLEVTEALLFLAMVSLAEGKAGEALVPITRAEALRAASDVGAAKLADVHVVYARALWAAPADGGRDRLRAQELAAGARSAYIAGGEAHARELAKLDAWLAEIGQAQLDAPG